MHFLVYPSCQLTFHTYSKYKQKITTNFINLLQAFPEELDRWFIFCDITKHVFNN